MNLVILNSCSEIKLMHLCKKEFYYFEIKKSIMETSLDRIPASVLIKHVLSHLEMGEVLALSRVC
ncbi:MAG: hypothetical protein KR126chlam6_01022 [Candidatus Anoxychlamydiales bacterium]|nr:hypothetical protein [Candidatus Anoxychlamydiales bacterium]